MINDYRVELKNYANPLTISKSLYSISAGGLKFRVNGLVLIFINKFGFLTAMMILSSSYID